MCFIMSIKHGPWLKGPEPKGYLASEMEHCIKNALHTWKNKVNKTAPVVDFQTGQRDPGACKPFEFAA